MTLRIASYNVEWFDHCFNPDNTLKTTQDATTQLNSVKEVLQLINADLITLTEAPNTTTTVGIQNTVTKLETFSQWAGLPCTKAMTGFISGGKQEIAILYNPQKMTVSHDPGGSDGSRSNPPFNGECFIDTDDDNIKEVYKHYRPPLEALVTLNISGKQFRIMGVHAKSKGIFTNMDRIHLEREARRNRLKLYAECTWVRKRVDDWLDDGIPFAVMGDINDGPGMDVYEARYGRSAVEIIMGDIFEPTKILRNYVGKPKWGRFGWSPSSARFKDRFTEDYVNVLIDHMLASSNLPVAGDAPAKVWNPYEHSELSDHKTLFKKASDHFPITLDIDL